MGENRGYPIDSQGGSFYVWEKIAILLSTAMILTGSCVSSVAVHAQTGYAAEYAQEASAAGVQSTAKLVAKGSCGSKAVYRLYSNGNLQIQGKGRLRLPMIFIQISNDKNSNRCIWDHGNR